MCKKSKNGPRKNRIHFWRTGFSPKNTKMDHEKIVYTSGEWVFPQKLVFSSKNVKMDHKKIVYTSGERFFLKKCKNEPRKNSIHFWEHLKNMRKTFKLRNGQILDAMGRESIPRGQKMMADSIFDVLEA